MKTSLKSPFTGGAVELIETPAKIIFRKEENTYVEYTYRCVDTGRTFTTNELDTKSLRQVYDQYCRRHGIPTREEIRTIRERYGLSTTAMSAILGLGENQYRLYEEGTILSESAGKLIRLAQDKTNMLRLLEISRAALSPKEYERFLESIHSSAAPVRFMIDTTRFSDMVCLEQVSGKTVKLSYAEKGYYRKSSYAN